jgi:hypothetical protein
VQIVVMLIFAIWLSLWFGQLCSRGHGTRCQGVQSKMMQNEQKYPWLYDSVVHQGYLSKFCELFCGHSSSSQEYVTVGINLGTIWLLFYYWTSKLINVLLFPSFPNSHHLRANFPKYKGPGPQIQMSRKIIDL